LPGLPAQYSSKVLSLRHVRRIGMTSLGPLLIAENAQNCFLSFLLSMVPARAVLFLFDVVETNVLRESSTSEFSHSLDPSRTSTF
jgi:hypothetical protein